MKSYVILVLGILFSLLAGPCIALANTQNLNVSFGVSGYPDSLYLECDTLQENCSTLISTTTPYTVLSYYHFAITGSSNDGSYCYQSFGSLGYYLSNFLSSIDSYLQSYALNSSVQVHCTQSFSTDNKGYYFVQYVPYDTRLISQSSLFPLTVSNSSSTPLWTQDAGDLKFGLATLIVLQGLVFMGLMFNSSRMKR